MSTLELFNSFLWAMGACLAFFGTLAALFNCVIWIFNAVVDAHHSRKAKILVDKWAEEAKRRKPWESGADEEVKPKFASPHDTCKECGKITFQACTNPSVKPLGFCSAECFAFNTLKKRKASMCGFCEQEMALPNFRSKEEKCVRFCSKRCLELHERILATQPKTETFMCRTCKDLVNVRPIFDWDARTFCSKKCAANWKPEEGRKEVEMKSTVSAILLMGLLLGPLMAGEPAIRAELVVPPPAIKSSAVPVDTKAAGVTSLMAPVQYAYGERSALEVQVAAIEAFDRDIAKTRELLKDPRLTDEQRNVLHVTLANYKEAHYEIMLNAYRINSASPEHVKARVREAEDAKREPNPGGPKGPGKEETAMTVVPGSTVVSEPYVKGEHGERISLQEYERQWRANPPAALFCTDGSCKTASTMTVNCKNGSCPLELKTLSFGNK